MKNWKITTRAGGVGLDRVLGCIRRQAARPPWSLPAALRPPPLDLALRGTQCSFYSQWPPVGRLSASKGYPRDLVSRLDFRRFSSPVLVFEELLKMVLGDL